MGALIRQIHELDGAMNEELRSSRRFVEKQELFNKKYMVGSKLFDAENQKAPEKNALIVCEISDKQGAWVDEMKDEVVKLLNEVIANDTETLNVATVTASGVSTWCAQFQSKSDSKKGLPDAMKWVNKNVSAKVCSGGAHPPDYVGMLHKFTGEGQMVPSRIFLCCSRSPEGATAPVVELIDELREQLAPPSKGEPVLPVNIVAFDPTIVGDSEQEVFFQRLAGPHGSFMIDTSAEDLKALDLMLKSVQVKKKQLDKLHKKLDKLEDFSERCTEDRKLLQVQIALQHMLQNDLDLCDWALKNEVPVLTPEI